MANMLFHAKWKDGNDPALAWGQDIEIVACVESDAQFEHLIEEHLLTSSCGDPVIKPLLKTPLLRDDIVVAYLGEAAAFLEVGLVCVVNAGA